MLLFLLANKQEKRTGNRLKKGQCKSDRDGTIDGAIVALSHKYVMCSDSGLGEVSTRLQWVIVVYIEIMLPAAFLFFFFHCSLHFFYFCSVRNSCRVKYNLLYNTTCCRLLSVESRKLQYLHTFHVPMIAVTDSNLTTCWGKTCGNMILILI